MQEEFLLPTDVWSYMIELPFQTTQELVASRPMTSGWALRNSLLSEVYGPEPKNPNPIDAYLGKFRIPATIPESRENFGSRWIACFEGLIGAGSAPSVRK